jgi:homospermidine synthase
MKLKFDKKILVIGYGAVSRCLLPMLDKHVELAYQNTTVIDFEDKKEEIQKWTSKGIKYVQLRITPENLAQVLSEYLEEGGMLIDLGWNIGCNDIVGWCHEHNVLYVNASVEQWDPYKDQDKKSAYEKSLYWRHMQLRKMMAKWKEKGPTAVLDHGANPGLISHFVKQGLIDIANRLIEDSKASEGEAEELGELIKVRDFSNLAMKLEVKVIHCSERDTQISNIPKEPNVFVNTWSIAGFHEEGIGPAEMGWGTHEKEIPAAAVLPEVGPKNQIFLQQSGINTWVYSFVPPDHEIIGMVIRHGEAFTISEKLTVYKDSKPIYRPTVHYAYQPCDAAIASLYELRGLNYRLVEKQNIYNDKDIIKGADILGALLMGHKYNSWWTGSDLSIEESRRIVPGQNATTIQVAAGTLAAVMWMIENPAEGVCVPDDLPHEYVLRIAKPYLGKFISEPFDWDPLKNRQILFPKNPALVRPDMSDKWQFKNFYFSP